MTSQTKEYVSLQLLHREFASVNDIRHSCSKQNRFHTQSTKKKKM